MTVYYRFRSEYSDDELKNKRLKRNQIRLLLFISLIIFTFFAGYSISYLIYQYKTSNEEDLNHLIDDSNDISLREKLFSHICSDNIKQNLKYLSSIPHVAGTSGDNSSVDYVVNKWKEQGLDIVKLIDYDVLLDFPDETKFNSIDLKNQVDVIEKTYEIKESVYDDDLDFTKITKPFLAFSKNGSVSSNEIYYVNFCDLDDFELINRENIDLTDKIVLCRYGKLFRGNKIRNAENYGAKGVLLFDDPHRSVPKKSYDKIYPNGEFLPKDGTQRGTIFVRDGDPLTPFYPSNKYSFRINETKSDLPKIIAQVIGYGLAGEIFNLLDQNFKSPLPDSWKGDMNVSYTFGGKLKNNRTLTINVYNKKQIRKIYNVIGIIKGTLEPDRYVMIGNHRDSWTFGSLDPSSATSVLLEISNGLMALKNSTKWSPKRSIMFLSWDAEEYGLGGSTEYVEEFLKKLSTNAVIYINSDIAVTGNFSYEAKASPLVHNLLFNITKSIYIDDNTTVFDRWLLNNPSESKLLPKLSTSMGSGSDHAVFLQRVGIPCIDQRFVKNRTDPLFKNIIGTYVLYHTSHETFNLVNKYVDPDFKASTLLAKIMAETVRITSSSLLLPFDPELYALDLEKQFKNFKDDFGVKLDSLNITLDLLEESINNFKRVTLDFKKRLDLVDKSKFSILRQYNDQLKNLERAFLDNSLSNTGYLHTLYAPSNFNKYIDMSFPGVTDSIYDYERNPNSNESVDKIKFNLSVLINSIQSAVSILKEPFDFERI